MDAKEGSAMTVVPPAIGHNSLTLRADLHVKRGAIPESLPQKQALRKLCTVKGEDIANLRREFDRGRAFT
jgi:hypothetical protein